MKNFKKIISRNSTMKKSYHLLIILGLLLFGFSNAANLFAQAKPAKAKQLPENSALLYEISGNGLKKPSYLFGTIHIICPNDMIPAEKLDEYLGKSEQVFMELDFDNQTEIQSMSKAAYLPDGKTLADFLTAEQYAKVGEMVKNSLGVPIENVKNIHPMILQTLIITSPKNLGCNPPGSYELSFLKTAAANKKPIEGLETVGMQLDTINSIPLDKQAEGLYKMALEPNKSIDEYKKLVETYKTQNLDKVYEFIQRAFADDPTFQVTLLDDRNVAWIPKIEKAIKEKPSFIAVGAGHLGGKTGVLNLLRAKGYKVQAIKL